MGVERPVEAIESRSTATCQSEDFSGLGTRDDDCALYLSGGGARAAIQEREILRKAAQYFAKETI